MYIHAERYLSNYLSLWLYMLKKNIMIIDFVNIIKAIASLSSEVLMKRMFTNFNILEVWFYDENYDNLTDGIELKICSNRSLTVIAKNFSTT